MAVSVLLLAQMGSGKNFRYEKLGSNVRVSDGQKSRATLGIVNSQKVR